MERDYSNLGIIILTILIGLFLFSLPSCSHIDTIKVKDYDVKTWVGYSDAQFSFAGQFVNVEYSGTRTVGLRLEEPIGDGWKFFKIHEGDVWLGMADLVFFKSQDWKKAWTIVRARLGQEVITVGILKFDRNDGTYGKELEWYEIRRK
jgi:hypothetical protein